MQKYICFMCLTDVSVFVRCWRRACRHCDTTSVLIISVRATEGSWNYNPAFALTDSVLHCLDEFSCIGGFSSRSISAGFQSGLWLHHSKTFFYLHINVLVFMYWSLSDVDLMCVRLLSFCRNAALNWWGILSMFLAENRICDSIDKQVLLVLKEQRSCMVLLLQKSGKQFILDLCKPTKKLNFCFISLRIFFERLGNNRA